MKLWYNVQTPMASFLYFNYFTHDISVDKVVKILKEKAEAAFKNTIEYLDQEYKKYCQKTGLNYTPVSWKPKVVSYEELYTEVKKEIGEELDERIAEIVEDLTSRREDPRIICLKIVEEVKKLSRDNGPTVVVFFAPPYCPHNTIKGKDDKEKELLGILNEVVEETAAVTGESFEIRNFFPFLSDSSYLTMDDGDHSINALINNFPEWHKIYPVPVEKIRDTNIPAVNFGTYGKDAHKWTERVHKQYTFSILPQMVVGVIEKILKK
jgi:arginine utilization protein RocB